MKCHYLSTEEARCVDLKKEIHGEGAVVYGEGAVVNGSDIRSYKVGSSNHWTQPP